MSVTIFPLTAGLVGCKIPNTMSDTTTATKRTTRRKTAAQAEPLLPELKLSSAVSSLSSKETADQEGKFMDLIGAISKTKEEFVSLQKEIFQIKEVWAREQEEHVRSITERDQEEDLTRKREKETYQYETAKNRRQEEDEFAEKKLKWEKDLQARRDELQKEKEELLILRKQVSGFEAELGKAVKEGKLSLQKELTDQFASEKKLREQEIKSEKELLGLKIQNLSQENTRQSQEVEALKKALENATAQLKDVAVRVIESSKPAQLPVKSANEN